MGDDSLCIHFTFFNVSSETTYPLVVANIIVPYSVIAGVDFMEPEVSYVQGPCSIYE